MHDTSAWIYMPNDWIFQKDNRGWSLYNRDIGRFYIEHQGSGTPLSDEEIQKFASEFGMLLKGQLPPDEKKKRAVERMKAANKNVPVKLDLTGAPGLAAALSDLPMRR